jgi:hypothetical protein
MTLMQFTVRKLLLTLDRYHVVGFVALFVWFWGLTFSVSSVVILLTSTQESAATEFARYTLTAFFIYTLAALVWLAYFVDER